ncbi:MAG: hypothetical protein KGL39_59160 [Patescibacteria group bacterium]|nr:hypothetical protein [Patescibacteria group bacterium]
MSIPAKGLGWFGLALFCALWIFVILALTGLMGCATQPLPSPKPVVVVAPESAAAKQAQADLAAEQTAEQARQAAWMASLSSISAGAGNVESFNASQPAGKFTTAIQDEASLIVSVAGKPTPQDEAMAAKRRLAVVSGDLLAIQTAYSGASKAVSSLQSQLSESQANLEASRASLAKSEALAKAQQAQAAAALQSQFNAKQAEINATRAAATAALSKEQARQRLLETGIFFGLSALLFLAAIACFWLKATYPLFGTRAALSLLLGSIGLAAMGTAIMEVQNFIALHPAVFWWSVIGIAVLACGGMFLIYSNHFHAQNPDPQAPLSAHTSTSTTITKLP